MTTLIADIEADDLLPGITRIWCLGVCDPSGDNGVLYADQSGYPPMSEGLQRLRTADRVVFHNGTSYDYWAIERFYPGTLRKEQIWDTLVVSRLWHPTGKHSLAGWGDRLKFPKGDHTEFDRWSPELGAYCLNDCKVTAAVYRRLLTEAKRQGDLAVTTEHKVAFIMARQEQHGFRLNLDACYDLVGELRQELSDIEARLQEIFPPHIENMKSRYWVTEDGKEWETKKAAGNAPGSWGRYKTKTVPFNPGSRQQVANRLTAKYGWKPRKFTPTGAPQIDESVLAELKYSEAAEFNRYLRIIKQLGQIADGENSWLKHERNGRVHGAVNPIGARTHRMSHFSPNLANVDKKELRMRAVWLADEGEVMVGCDADGLELRMLGHYLARWDDGLYASAVVSGSKDDGTDVHTMTQRAINFHNRDPYTKNATYGYLYGAGNPKLGMICHDDSDAAKKPRRKGSLGDLGKQIRDGLETNIKGLGPLQAALKKKHKGHLNGVPLKSLDGRYIESVSAHSALNTLLQGAGAVVMKHALVIFDETMNEMLPEVPFNYLVNVHDEVQLSTPKEYAELVGETFAGAITEAGVRLGLKCPLSGSYKIGANWKETH